MLCTNEHFVGRSWIFLNRGVRVLALIVLGVASLAVTRTGAAPPSRPLELHYQAAAFRPDDPVPAPPDWYRDVSETESPRGRRYLVAITSTSLDADQLRQLDAAGATLLGYVPVHG